MKAGKIVEKKKKKDIHKTKSWFFEKIKNKLIKPSSRVIKKKK